MFTIKAMTTNNEVQVERRIVHICNPTPVQTYYHNHIKSQET
jgi:hypothetical protein